MREALRESCLAAEAGEVPVGAVVINAHGEVVGKGHNASVATSDPTGHAEIIALRKAAITTGNYRLNGCVLVVTLEPCLMCAGAIIHARVDGVVYGTPDPRAGAVISRLDGLELAMHNHTPWHAGKILEEECATQLRDFFASKRTFHKKRQNTTQNAPEKTPECEDKHLPDTARAGM